MRAQALFDPGGTQGVQRAGSQVAQSLGRERVTTRSATAPAAGDETLPLPYPSLGTEGERRQEQGERQHDRQSDRQHDRQGGERGGVGTRRERLRLAVRERMPLWLQLRCGMERRSLIALVVVLVVAVAFAVQHFWTGEPRSVRAPQAVGEAAPDPSPGPPAENPGSGTADGLGGPGTQGPSGTSGGAGGPGGSGGRIVVDVSGKVRKPGIHRLPAGARVADALEAAGGARPGADTNGLNRARLLTDGEQVLVGVPQPPGTAGPSTSAGAASPGGSGAGASAGGSAAGPISLNTATADQLDTLPGVGPVLAQHIIDYRTQHGGFRAVDELREVNGIGERRFADLKNAVRP